MREFESPRAYLTADLWVGPDPGSLTDISVRLFLFLPRGAIILAVTFKEILPKETHDAIRSTVDSTGRRLG